MASLKSLDVRLGVTNLGGFKSALGQGAGAVDDFGRKVDKGVDGAGKKLDTLSGRSKAAAAGLAGGLVGAGVFVALKRLVGGIGSIGVAYEDSLNTFRAVSGANVEQMGAVAGAAKALGNDLTLPGTSAAGAATALTELAKAGLSVDQALAAGKGTLQLAAAGALDEASAATIAANALNAFGLSGDKAASVANVLANAANVSSGEVTDFASGLTQVSAVARGAGLSLEETTGALALFANQGLAGSDAGTSLKTALLRLQAPTAEAASTLKAVGLNTRDASGEMLPFRELVTNLQSSMGELSAEQRDQAMATIFGQDAIRAASILYREGVGEVDRYTAGVSRAGGAAEVAAAKSQGLGGALRGLQSQLETYAIAIYERAAPGTAALVAGFSGALPGAIEVVGDALSLLGPLLETLGDIGGDLATVIGTLAEAFLPLGRALATVAVVAVVTFFTALAVAISGVTDVVADHKAVVLVLAAIYLGTLTPSILAASAAMRAQVASKLGAFLLAVRGGAMGAAGGMAALGTASGIATAGLTLIVGGLALLIAETRKGETAIKKHNKGLAEGIFKPEQAKTLSEMRAAYSAARNELTAGADAAERGQKKWGGLHTLFTKGVVAVERENDTLNLNREALEKLAGPMAAVEDNARALGAAFGLTAEDAAKLATKNGVDLTGSFGDAYYALKPLVDVTREGSTPTLALAEANKTLADATSTAADKADALKAKLDLLMGNHISAQRAAIGYEKSVADLAASFVENGRTLDINTAAGQANRGAILDAADATQAHIEALISEKGVTDDLGPTFDAHVDKLRTTLEAAHLTTGQIDSMTRSIGLVPGGIDTYVRQHGSAEAKAALDGVTTAAGRIPPVVPVAVNVVVNGINSLNGVAVKLDRLDGRVVSPIVRIGKPLAKLDRLDRATGGTVPGVGDTDSVPAVLTPGEYVIRKPAAKAIGLANLHRLNAMGYAAGGQVAPAGVVARAMPIVSVAAGGAGRDPDLAAALRDLRRLAPVVGSLTVQHNSERASARQIVDEGFFAARVAGMRRRG